MYMIYGIRRDRRSDKSIISDCMFFFSQNFTLCGQLIKGMVKLFSLKMISYNFKQKIQKTKRFFFSYLNILETYLIRTD